MNAKATPDLVLRVDAESVATLTLNRPEKRNAINRELFRTMRAHILALQEARSLGLGVIRGAGEPFCAGHDLSETAHADSPAWLRCTMKPPELITRLRHPGHPTGRE